MGGPLGGDVVDFSFSKVAFGFTGWPQGPPLQLRASFEMWLNEQNFA